MIRKTTAFLLFCYFLVLVYWMFFGFHRFYASNAPYTYNLVPFHTIKQYIFNAHYFNIKTWVINVYGNIGVFIPFGLCLPYVFRLRFVKFLLRFITGIILLELLQMLSKRGSFDVDDIILNTFGAIVGFLFYKGIRALTCSEEVNPTK